jgi:hypothetical protein
MPLKNEVPSSRVEKRHAIFLPISLAASGPPALAADARHHALLALKVRKGELAQ